MTQAERMAKARENAVAMLNLPEKRWHTAVGTYVVETPDGYVKITVSAVKDEDFNPEQAQSEYEFDREEARVKAEKRKAEADAKKQANIAKKEAKAKG